MKSSALQYCILVMAALVLCSVAAAHEGSPVPGPQPVMLAAGERPADGNHETTKVVLRLEDVESGELVNGLVRIRDAQGAYLRLEGLLPRSTGITERSFGAAAFSHLNSWHVLCGEATLNLPIEALVVEAFSGLEYAQTTKTLSPEDVQSGEIEVLLHRFYNRDTRGFVTGNVHLHLQQMTMEEAEWYATQVARADGYDLVFFSYLERAEADEHYISNNFTREDLRRFTDSSGVRFGWGEEYRHNFSGVEGYGHVMFLDLQDLILPASFGPDITKKGNDDGTLRPGIIQAREQDATILWCHNRQGHEDIPNWIAGLVDGQIVFDQGSVGDYGTGFYRYLNIGLHVPIATGTDWFFRDMALTYVNVEQPATTESWLAALRAGRSFISNGPLLDLRVNGEEPGTTVGLETPGYVRVEAQAAGRNDFGKIEVVANGNVVATASSESVKQFHRASLDEEIAVTEPTWFALRITPFEGPYDRPEVQPQGFNEYGKPLFAHTSPVYVDLRGEGVFIEEAARSLIVEMEESKAAIAEHGSYSNEQAQRGVLSLYDEGIATLEAVIEAND